jgi:hypothetical protein
MITSKLKVDIQRPNTDQIMRSLNYGLHPKPADLACNIIPGYSINGDLNHLTASKRYPPACIELIDSKKWISKYGLEANKLQFDKILTMIGFRQTTSEN